MTRRFALGLLWLFVACVGSLFGGETVQTNEYKAMTVWNRYLWSSKFHTTQLTDPSSIGGDASNDTRPRVWIAQHKDFLRVVSESVRRFYPFQVKSLISPKPMPLNKNWSFATQTFWVFDGHVDKISSIETAQGIFFFEINSITEESIQNQDFFHPALSRVLEHEMDKHFPRSTSDLKLSP
jgi:hypothetical protein